MERFSIVTVDNIKLINSIVVWWVILNTKSKRQDFPKTHLILLVHLQPDTSNLPILVGKPASVIGLKQVVCVNFAYRLEPWEISILYSLQRFLEGIKKLQNVVRCSLITLYFFSEYLSFPRSTFV